MSEKNKRDLGQYFTKDSLWLRPHIRGHIESLLAEYPVCVDPFAGAGHLLKVAKAMGFQTQGHDIDAEICQNEGWGEPNDSIRHVVRHEGAFVLTNPPYLAKNSAKRMKSPMVEYFQPGFIKTLDDSRLNVLDDLFKLAMEQNMAAFDESVWIVPESGIQDLDDLPHWKDRLHSVTILEENPFDDTEHPVCVMIFSKRSPLQEVWKNDDRLGLYDDLRSIHNETAKGPMKATPMKFNAPEGTLGYRAVDGTKGDGSMRIKFCRGEELGYDRSNIKVSSRHLTYIAIELQGELLDKVIAEANVIIDAYRHATHDVFLTAFMGNAKDGVRRRRLDYKLARKIFNIAFKRTTSMVNLRDYMTAHFKDIVPGDKMTKNWRKKVIGGGKAMGGAVSSLAEKWQRMCLEKITSTPCAKTNLRLNLATSELKIVTRPSNEPDEFEWTEDFDGEFHVGKTRYLVNFKMIVGTGGAQTRSMREVYHFIKCQEAYLKSSGDKHTKFLNILDGDSVGAKMDVMRKACSKKRAVNIFVGDTHEIKKAWKF